MSAVTGFEHIVVSGGPEEVGFGYGSAARARVHRSREAYAAIFGEVAGWDWEQVRASAETFLAPIAAYDEKYLRELRGIAEGSGLDLIDVVAMNVRTEIMFAAKAAKATAHTGGARECTSLAVAPERAVDGRMLLGQNWDWIEHAVDTTVLLEVHQDEGPDYVTLVEAGLLAKAGMNSSGIGLCANALVSDADRGEPGVPFHVLLRAVLDAETGSDALHALGRARRASSGNYLIGDQDGVVLDIETMPGDHRGLSILHPQDGLLIHANHFLQPPAAGTDVVAHAMPDSPFRVERLRQLTASGPVSRTDMQAAFADHALYPLSICTHPDVRDTPVQSWRTVAGLVMDVGARRLWIAAGYPCTEPFVEYDLSDALRKPSPVRAGRTPR